MVIPSRIQFFHYLREYLQGDILSEGFFSGKFRSHYGLVSSAPHQEGRPVHQPLNQRRRLFPAFVRNPFRIRICPVSEEKFLPYKDSSPIRLFIKFIRLRDSFAPNPQGIHIGIFRHIKQPHCPVPAVAVRIPLKRIHTAAPEADTFSIDDKFQRRRHFHFFKTNLPFPFIHDVTLLGRYDFQTIAEGFSKAPGIPQTGLRNSKAAFYAPFRPGLLHFFQCPFLNKLLPCI